MEDLPRSREAREAAEAALVRVVHHYGARPEFVVLGGLVPELLCSGSDVQHAGTTDIDVQVNLEIACGSVNTERLERALLNAEFEPDDERTWRWSTGEGRTVVKFELLADLDDQPAETTITFDSCERLGAANLRGTGYAIRDVEVRTLSARVGDDELTVEINVTGLAGFLLAKCSAARSRRKPKDWYDEAGGPIRAAGMIRDTFATDLNAIESTLDDLFANFSELDAQGPNAYQEQMMIDHPELDAATLRADAVTAVKQFIETLRQ